MAIEKLDFDDKAEDDARFTAMRNTLNEVIDSVNSQSVLITTLTGLLKAVCQEMMSTNQAIIAALEQDRKR